MISYLAYLIRTENLNRLDKIIDVVEDPCYSTGAKYLSVY